jgi:hypothetical protein
MESRWRPSVLILEAAPLEAGERFRRWSGRWLKVRHRRMLCRLLQARLRRRRNAEGGWEVPGGRIWGGRPEAGRTRAARSISPLSSCAKQESLFRRWINARFASPRLPLLRHLLTLESTGGRRLRHGKNDLMQSVRRDDLG